MSRVNRLVIPDGQGTAQEYIVEDQSARAGAAQAARLLGVTEILPDIGRGYINGNGSIGSLTSINYALTDYIQVPSSGKVVIRWTGLTGTPGLRIGVYDSSKTWVERKGINPATLSTSEYTHTADAGTWLRVNWDESDQSALYGVSFAAGYDGFLGEDDVPSALSLLDTKLYAEGARDLDWGWTIGSIDTSTGAPSVSTIRIRSFHVPVGKGTRLVSSASGYRALWVMTYGNDWGFTSALSSWTNEWVAPSDCWIRVIIRSGGGDPEITDIDETAALLSCTHYVAPAFHISSELMRWCASGLVDGVPTGASANALSMRGIEYADRTVTVKLNPDAYHVTAAFYAADGTFIRQSGATVAGMVCIPKGMYYRLSVNALPAAVASPALLDGYTIRQGEDLLWYGSTSGYGTVAFFPRTNELITPDILYSGRGVTVRCTDSQYTIKWIGYDSADPYGGLKRSCALSSTANVAPQSYYRLAVVWNGEGTVDISDAEAQLIWERAEDVDPGLAAAGIAANVTADVGELPSYYTSDDNYIAGKAATINGLRSDDRVQFAFVTDYHMTGYASRGGQTGHSGALLKYLAENTMVDLCVNGGDIANGDGRWADSTEYKAIFRRQIRSGCAALRVPGMVTLYVAGNHDGGKSGDVPAAYARRLTEDELCMTSGLQALRGHVIVDQRNPLQYYVDDVVHNVRYIVAALGLNNRGSDSSNPPIVTTQTTEEAFCFIATALRTAPANCGIVIFNHEIMRTDSGYVTTTYGHTTQLMGLVDAYKARSADYTVSTYSTSRSDFSGCTGRVLAIIGGHSHFDYSFTSTGGIPVITTTTDCAGGQFLLSGSAVTSKPRPTSDIREQAFDVFTVEPSTGKIWATRIGGGSESDGSGADRTWNV